MKIALVCDSISAYGGAERVIEQILAVYPTADVFSIVDVVPEGQRKFLGGRKVRTSGLQRLPGIAKYYRHLLHFWPMAVEQFDVMDYDLVISSHHSVANGVLTRPGQVHVSYVHSPMRYAWDLQHDYLRSAGLDHGAMGLLARRTLHKVRMWDYAAAQRPDVLAANSQFVAERMWKAHRRRAEVIHPPVAIKTPGHTRGRDSYYVSVGRLVPYKRVDLLVRAFSKMPRRHLKIVGDGPEMKNLIGIKPANVDLLGYRPENEMHELLASASAYLFAGVEDFGITAVEAQAAGTPVIAFRSGGLAETVRGPESSSPTGLFFNAQSEGAIIAAVEDFERNKPRFSAETCMANASRFSECCFREKFKSFVERALLCRWHPAAEQPEVDMRIYGPPNLSVHSVIDTPTVERARILA